MFLWCGCTSSTRQHMLSVFKILTTSQQERVSLCFICLSPLSRLCHGHESLPMKISVCLQMQSLLCVSVLPGGVTDACRVPDSGTASSGRLCLCACVLLFKVGLSFKCCKRTFIRSLNWSWSLNINVCRNFRKPCLMSDSETLKAASNNTVSTDDNLCVVCLHLFGSVCADKYNNDCIIFTLPRASIKKLFFLLHEDLLQK